MSNLLKALFLFVFLLPCACSYVPDDTDDVYNDYYRPVHHIKSADTFLPDKKNVKYTENQQSVFETVKNPIIIEPENNIQKNSEPEKYSRHLPRVMNSVDTNIKNISYQISAILFDNGMSAVAPVYEEELSKIAELAKQKNAKIFVYGYASSKTSKSDSDKQKKLNSEIALKRARNVADVFIKKGLKAENVNVISLGDTSPLYSETTPEGERLNRRAEIYISY